MKGEVDERQLNPSPPPSGAAVCFYWILTVLIQHYFPKGSFVKDSFRLAIHNLIHGCCIIEIKDGNND